MPLPTAFHPRTSALCESLNYRDWAGFYAVSAYETTHTHEYSAIRHAVGLIDVSPLFKYLITGPQATELVNRVITRDAARVAVGQVIYSVWCDERGKVIDDGTLTRLEESTWRLTAADPSLRWLQQNTTALDVRIADVTEQIAALAVQGPLSAALLRSTSDVNVDRLAYYRMAEGTIAGVPVHVSRTGYTGDLGYEIWMPWRRALEVWDALNAAGRSLALTPVGMLALDVARIEAGLLLIDVDYQSSRKALVDAQRYTPFELGLGRLVDDRKPAFVGRAALIRERAHGHARQIVGLEISWSEVEKLYTRAGLPPHVPAIASRVAVPVYKHGRQAGKATSLAWSPTLKRLIALATISRPHYAVGTHVDVEVTVEAVRHRVDASVVETPFFKPARKTATPPA
jgi:aminomethyltransferase